MSKRNFAILLLSLCCLGSIAQRYPRRKILKDLATLPGFEDAFIGFTLYDPAKEKVIAQQFADRYMTPASLTKLFTYYAAKTYLPDTLSALEYVVKGDSLIFRSTGYPLTLHPNHCDTTVSHFLSGTEKNLFYWPRPTEDKRFGPGWAWDDYQDYYSAERSVFPIYGNSIQVIVDNKNRKWQVSPIHSDLKISIKNASGTHNRLTRDEFRNHYEVAFKTWSDTDSIAIDTLFNPFHYSDSLFLSLLSKASGKQITLLQGVQKPKSFRKLAK